MREPFPHDIEHGERGHVALWVEDHVGPARPRRDRHVHAGVLEVRRKGPVGGHPVSPEQKCAPKPTRGHRPRVQIRDGRDRLAGEDEPADLQPSVRQIPCGIVGEAQARALEGGERSLLPVEGTTVGRVPPQDHVVDGCTIGDGPGCHESAETEADDGHPLDPGKFPQPRRGVGDGRGPCADQVRLARVPVAVAGCRQVEAQGRMAGRREGIGPGASCSVGRDLVPSPRRTDEDGGR